MNTINNMVNVLIFQFLFIVVQKVITFSLNQSLIYVTTPEIFGLAAIPLELYLSTLLFLSREGIRLAVYRLDVNKYEQRKLFINMSWLPSIILAILTVLIIIISTNIDMITFYLPILLYFHSVDNIPLDIIIIYSTGALLESVGEPWINISMKEGSVTHKITAETFAITTKSLSSLILVGYYNLGIKGFALSQIIYGLTYLLTLISLSNHKLIDYLPAQLNITTNKYIYKYIDINIINIAVTTSFSSIFKHILTESDKIALTIISNHHNQGIYALASNYGSLVARIIYLPLEDSSRILFSNLSIKISNKQSDKSELLHLLQQLLILVLFIGLTILIHGVSYMHLVIPLLFRNQWNNKDMILTLQWYCVYLFLMGCNGLFEAFIHSIANQNDFKTINYTYLYSSLSFCVSLLYLSTYYDHLNTSIIVISNCVSMFVRILFSYKYIIRYFNTYLTIKITNKYIMFIMIDILLIQLTIYPFQLTEIKSTDILIQLLVGLVYGLIYLFLCLFYFISYDQLDYYMKLLSNKKIKSN